MDCCRKKKIMHFLSATHFETKTQINGQLSWCTLCTSLKQNKNQHCFNDFFFYLTGFSVVDSDVPGKAGLVGESLETLFTLERRQVKMDIDMSHKLMTLV